MFAMVLLPVEWQNSTQQTTSQRNIDGVMTAYILLPIGLSNASTL
jgi:hypothetical protein